MCRLGRGMAGMVNKDMDNKDMDNKDMDNRGIDHKDMVSKGIRAIKTMRLVRDMDMDILRDMDMVRDMVRDILRVITRTITRTIPPSLRASSPLHSIRTIRTIRTISRRPTLATRLPTKDTTNRLPPNPTPDPMRRLTLPEPTSKPTSLPTLLRKRTNNNAAPLAIRNNCVSSLCLFVTNRE